VWEALQALEATVLAQHLRGSTYTYPLVNALHIIGIALLFGGIAPLDLRLLGAWRFVPPAPLLKVCRQVAAFGLVLAVSMGFLLFAVRATEYAAKPAFLLKMALLALALANIALAERALARGGGLRLSAALSLTLWLAVILAGRAIAYF
jgi:hypothetical protein